MGKEWLRWRAHIFQSLHLRHFFSSSWRAIGSSAEYSPLQRFPFKTLSRSACAVCECVACSHLPTPSQTLARAAFVVEPVARTLIPLVSEQWTRQVEEQLDKNIPPARSILSCRGQHSGRSRRNLANLPLSFLDSTFYFGLWNQELNSLGFKRRLRNRCYKFTRWTWIVRRASKKAPEGLRPLLIELQCDLL